MSTRNTNSSKWKSESLIAILVLSFLTPAGSANALSFSLDSIFGASESDAEYERIERMVDRKEELEELLNEAEADMDEAEMELISAKADTYDSGYAEDCNKGCGFKTVNEGVGCNVDTDWLVFKGKNNTTSSSSTRSASSSGLSRLDGSIQRTTATQRASSGSSGGEGDYFYDDLNGDNWSGKWNKAACVKIYDAVKEDSKWTALREECREAILDCPVIEYTRQYEEAKDRVEEIEKAIKGFRSQVRAMNKRYRKLFKNCSECRHLFYSKLAQRKLGYGGRDYSEPGFWDYLLGFTQVLAPAAIQGIGLYQNAKSINKFWGGYSDYLNQCRTVGIPCQPPGGMGGFGGYGAGGGLAGLYGGGMFPGMVGGLGGLAGGIYGGLGGIPGLGGGIYGGLGGIPGLGGGIYGGFPSMGGIYGGITGGVYGNPYMTSGIYGGFPSMGGVYGGFPAMGGIYGGVAGGIYGNPYGVAGLGGIPYGGAYGAGLVNPYMPVGGFGAPFGASLGGYQNPALLSYQQASMNSSILQAQRAQQAQQNLMISQQQITNALSGYYQTAMQAQAYNGFGSYGSFAPVGGGVPLTGISGGGFPGIGITTGGGLGANFGMFF